MQSRIVSLGAVLVSLTWVACSRDAAVTNQTASSVPAVSNSSQRTPPSTGTVRQVEDDRFAFQFQQQEVQLDAQTRILSRDLHEENKNLKFEIDISFPQIVGTLRPQQRSFNLTVASLARKNFNDFKGYQLRPRAHRFPPYHADVVEFLQISYDLPLIVNEFVSVRFNAHTYGRGAAHSVQYFFVFNYDLTSGRQIRLSDLFKRKSGHLSFISTYAREMVTKRICNEGGWGGNQPLPDCLKNAPLWETGIEPKAENFEAWNLTRDGLLFSIDACKLTGCASGEFYVSIPYAQLKNLLRTKSAIEVLMDRQV